MLAGGHLAPHHLTNPRIFQRVCYAQPVMLTCANYLLPGAVLNLENCMTAPQLTGRWLEAVPPVGLITGYVTLS